MSGSRERAALSFVAEGGRILETVVGWEEQPVTFTAQQ